MKKYVYPAVFTPEESGYSVYFPDIEGCFTCGDDLQDAIAMAEDALSIMLYEYETNQRPIPEDTPLDQIKTEPGEFANYIVADTSYYQMRSNKKPVKRMISLPTWLDQLARERKLSLSRITQEAVAAKLGIQL